jgi:hypothetical protein
LLDAGIYYNALTNKDTDGAIHTPVAKGIWDNIWEYVVMEEESQNVLDVKTTEQGTQITDNGNVLCED